MASFISWIPTPFEDIVYDLGSGDGRLLFAALEKGAGMAVGVELNPDHVQAARDKANEKGLEGRVAFIEADVMDVDLSQATVVLCYLITAASAALKPKFEAELKPGTRVVMESFPVHGWKPVETREVGYGTKTFYLYRMPPEMDEKAAQRSVGSEYPGYGYFVS